MIVYLIRNTAENKCYVGKTSRTLAHRWSQHKAEARLGRKDTPLYRAMRTFQSHCFEIEILGEANSQRRIAQMERKFIRIFRAVEEGYNVLSASVGGRVRIYRTSNYQITPEHRRRINESLRRTFAERKQAAA